MRSPLPIDDHIPYIIDIVRQHRALVLTALPGAGKTTRVPPALSADGPVIVLQPRRVAARSIARRIAGDQGWTLGREVGWHVRFERQYARDTQVLLATEGILTARLQQDPLLSDFRTVVLDEFHERTIHADLGIALARQAWLARTDLRLVVMSATLDAASVAEYLENCPVLHAGGELHPLEIRYMPDAPLAAAVATAARDSSGSVLCFLAGAPEIARAEPDVQRVAAMTGIEVVRLHGSMPAGDQDAALESSSGRRIILATNIAETSVTVPGVRAVVDTGLQKVARYDATRGIDLLRAERVSRDSADQRAGRAGRLGPGLVIRLWSGRDRLAEHREPEVRRIDLSGSVLEILAWGGDPRALEWLEPPPEARVDDAFRLLDALGATGAGRLTPLGRRMQRLPIPPRLARILLEARGAQEAARACALLAEAADRSSPRQRTPPTTSSDLLSAVEAGIPPHVERTARVLHSLAASDCARRISEPELLRAIFSGYPDRVARRRDRRSNAFLLVSGHGAVLDESSGVRDAEFIAALDVVGAKRGDIAEARIRMASAVERAWLAPTEMRIRHWLDPQSGTVRASTTELCGAIVLSETPAAPDPAEAARLMSEAFLSGGLSAEDQQLVRRLVFAGLEHDVRELAGRAAALVPSMREMKLLNALDYRTRRDLDALAPVWLDVPSGRRARLEYHSDGTVLASVKLQELFGLAETPRVGRRGVPVTFALLAPNGRPVQMTRDLRSFWERTYPEVRKELRGRYPKHPWPEDPWTAPPTARTSRRRRDGV